MDCSPVRGQQERQLPSPFPSTASPKGSRISLLGLSSGIPTGSSSPGLHPSLPSRLTTSSFSSRLGSPGLWSPFLLTGTSDSRLCFGLWDPRLSPVPASSLATAGGPGRGGPGEGSGTGRGPEGGYMFIGALFTRAKTENYPNVHGQVHGSRRWGTYIQQSTYSATTENEIMPSATKWMVLEIHILYKGNQKDKCHMMSFIGGISTVT